MKPLPHFAQRQALVAVHGGRFRWCDTEGPFGGFIHADGSRIQPGDQLVALYELRQARLIAVNTATRRVGLTGDGAAWIMQWSLSAAS